MKALNKNVILKPVRATSPAGLSIPDSCQEKNRGTIVSVGYGIPPEAKEILEEIQAENKVVIYPEASANAVKQGDDQLLVLNYELLLAEL